MYKKKKSLIKKIKDFSSENSEENDSLFPNDFFSQIPIYSSSIANSKFPFCKRGHDTCNNKKENKSFDDYPIDFEEIEIEDDEKIKKIKKKRKKIKNTSMKKGCKTIQKIRAKTQIRKRNKREVIVMEKNRKNNISRKQKINKDLSTNTITEINECYEKMKELISNYSFNQISELMIKIFNDIDVDRKDTNNNELYQKIKKITSKIHKKEIIPMMCLNILSSKNALNNNDKLPSESEVIEIKEDSKEHNDIVVQIEKEEEEEVKEQEKEELIEIDDEIEEIEEQEHDEVKVKIDYINEIAKSFECKKKNPIIQSKGNKKIEKELLTFNNDIFIKSFKEITQDYSLGTHYYKNKKNQEIFSYRGRNAKYKNISRLYCCKTNKRCKAMCLINKQTNKVKLIGKHYHDGMKHITEFYETYPDLVDEEWEHIQIINVGNEVKVIIQS